MKIFNFRLIIYILSLVLVFEGVFMILSIIASLVYDKSSILPITYSSLITFSIGGALFFFTRKGLDREPSIKDGFLVVTLCWLVLSLFGTLPYLFSHSIPGFVDAFFESTSGFTTTGSSILTDIESMPRGILFWRSETHWMGGMGIIMMVLAIFPYFKYGGMHLFGAEFSTILFEKFKPKLIDTAKRLWFIYILLTVSEIILLSLGGMQLFDSICHSFGTIATGGFSTKNASIGAYSPYIQYVIIIFMTLSGISFAAHYHLLKGNFRKFFKNQEIKYFITIILIAGISTTIYLFKAGYPLEKAFRNSFFQIVSIITSTGFATDDYIYWPKLATAFLFALMFVGGCAGSTSGGIKVVRHLIFVKRVILGIKSVIHPTMIKKVRFNENNLDESLTSSIISFILIYLLTFCIGTIVMSFLNLPLDVALSSVATTMGGIGPGFGMVGPFGNFAEIPEFGKYFLSFLMILGRLEILSVLVIFTRRFWHL